MSYFGSWTRKWLTRRTLLRYGIPLVNVSIAFLAIFILRLFQVRDPFASVFLVAVAASLLHGGIGPGIVAIALSIVSLQFFLHTPGGWLHIAIHDLPIFCVFLAIAAVTIRFMRKVAADRAELERSHAKLDILLSTISIGVVNFGPDRVVQSCNRAYETMLQLEPGEIIGRPAPLPESEREIWKLQEEQLRKGQPITDYETKRIRKDGSEFDATITAVPRFAKDGTYLGVVGTIIDTTERHKQEAQMRILSAMAQRNPHFMGVARISGEAEFVNPSGRKMFGIKPDADITLTNVYEYFALSQRALAMEMLIPILVEKHQLDFETLGRNRETGEEFSIYCTCFTIPDAKTGEPEFIAAVAQDITDQKRTEAYLREGQKISHTGSWAWNRATGESFWSDELFRILGLGPEAPDATTPDAYLECVEPGDRLEVERAWRSAFEEGTNVDLMHRIVHPDGSVRHVRILGHPVPAARGQLAFIGTVMDVTEQHEDRVAREKAVEEREALRAETAALRERELLEYARALQDEYAPGQRQKFEKIIGSSPALQRTFIRMDRATRTDATVLITGETGTGKGLIAQAIHQNSSRSSRPMITVDCAALMGTPIATALFGYERGAFTGADERHRGSFEVAQGSTAFVDEIGELPLETQASLLRVIDEHVIQRVGGTTPIPVDVRIIAATNRDLEAAVAAGTFRADLFYRLHHLRIPVPPLRERREDIPALVHYFAEQAATKYGKTIRNIAGQTIQLLSSYDWPGNIREMQHMIDGAVLECPGDTLSISVEKFPRQSLLATGTSGSLAEELANYERRLIEQALAECHGHVHGPMGASARLKIKGSTLDGRIAALKIDRFKFR